MPLYILLGGEISMDLVGKDVVLTKNVKNDWYEFSKGSVVQVTSKSIDGYDILDCDGRPILGCGYDFCISLQKHIELFGNMLEHIIGLVSSCDLEDTLHLIGFTDEELKAFDIILNEKRK